MIVGFISMLGPMELGIILLLVLMLFGAGRIPQVMHQLGQGVRAIKDATRLNDE